MSSASTTTRPPLQARQPVRFVLESVRGAGQVDLQPNLLTGALILASLWVAGWEIGLFATLGTLTSTLTAYVTGVDRGSISLGLQGYCGCLTGIAMVTTLGHHLSAYVLAILGASLCTVIQGGLTTFLKPYGVPPLTIPFCLVSGVMLVGAPSLERIWHGLPPNAVSSTTSGDTGMTWNDLWHSFFTNVSEIFLVDAWYVGLIMLVGLAVAGRLVVLYAALGSVVGTASAWALGAPTALIANGIYGYNAVLVCIALGAVLLRNDGWTLLYAICGGAAATALTAALTTFFKTFGGHTFTWPFNLVTWFLLMAVPQLTRLQKAT